MNGKKRYLAIILFLLIGLTIFAFANPTEEEDLSGKDGNSEVTDKTDNEEKPEEDEDGKLVNSSTDDDQDNTKENQNNNKVDKTNENAKKAVELAEKTLTSTDLAAARVLVALVKDSDLKEELTERLDAVEDAINAIALVETLEQMTNESTSKDDISTAISYREDKQVQAAIAALTNEELKTELQARLDAVNKILNDTTSPVIEGVEDGETTNQNVTITVTDDNEVTATVTLNGTEIENTATFTEEGEYVFTVVDAAFNETVVTFTIDTTAPEFVGLSSGSHYDSITLDATDATEVKFTVENKDNGEIIELSVGETLTEDATYYITATDAAGNTKSVWVAIDTTAPVISGVDETKPTNKNEIVYVKDKFLMTVTIDGVEYTREDFEVESNNENFSFQKKVTHAGTHTVTATDKFGNTTTVTFVIDKTAPEVVSVEKSNNDKSTNQDVTVTLTVNEAIVTPEGWTKVSDTEFTKVYSENGKYSVEITDIAGNTNTVKFEVKRIDKVAPTATVTKSNNDKSTNQDVVVTIVANEAIYKPEGWTEVSTNKEHEFTKIYSENGDYSVEITDKAGNKSVINFAVSGIDREAPERSSLRIIGGNYYNENGKHVRYATNGTTVYVYTTFAEELGTAPTVTLNGTVSATSYLAKADEGSYIYAAKFVISENDGLANGELKFEVTGYADAAGNVGRVLTNEDITLASQKYVIIDKTPVTFTLSSGTIGTNPYSKINLKLYDANGVASVEINGTKLPHTGKYVDINDGDAYTFVEGENVVTVTDKAGNKTTMTYVKDATAPTIELAGTEGRNNNEYRVEAGTEVSISDVMATATDNYDENVDVVITKADFLATKEHPERNVYGYDFSNGFDTTTVGRYNITYAATDDAGNSSTKVMLLVISDTTAPTVTLKGTEGRNNNELRVSQDTVVTLDDVTATSNDIVDGEKENYPVSITRYYPRETGKSSHKYDATNGFDTTTPGYYTIKYEVTDEAGNTTTATMLLVVNVTKAPEVIDGEANLYGNLTLIDEPFYNVNDNTEEVVINGNGYSVTQIVTSADKFQWIENGTRPLMSNIFSSSNGSKLTVNDLTLKGTTSSVMLGHYKDATYNNYNTELNNVNMVGLEVVSFSAGIAPAATVYGTATLNNVNLYGTKLSSLDTDPMWPVYDLAVVNYANTTINGGKIGSIYTRNHALVNLNDTEVDTIITAATHTKGGGIVVGEGTTVDTIKANYHRKIAITVKSGAVVDTIDLTSVTDLESCSIIIEDGATVNEIIYRPQTVTSLDELKSALEAGVKNIKIDGEITVDEKLTVSSNTTISGGKLVRANDYTGTFFVVEEGVTLTMKDTEVDGNNDWSLDTTNYNNYLNNATNVTSEQGAFIFTTLEEGKPVATSDMFVVNGNLKLKGVTIKNHVGTSGASVIDDGNSSATITMTNTTIEHCATPNSSTVVSLENGGQWIINDGTVIQGNHSGSNGGIVRVNYETGKVTMNGGKIINNTSVNSNGTFIMLWNKSTFEMNGGEISGNTGLNGWANGRNAAIYVHSSGNVVMNDGTISNNTGTSYGGIDVRSHANSVIINGGSIVNNTSVLNNTNKDINGSTMSTINGGTFTQDVTTWVAEGKTIEANDGVWTVK